MDSAREALEQAQDLLDKMSFDESMEDRLEGHRREIASIEALLKKAFVKAEQNIERESLLGVRMNDLDLTSKDHQKRYANTTEALDSHSEMIRDSQRMTEATISLAQDSMVELDRQNEVITRSHNRVCS